MSSPVWLTVAVAGPVLTAMLVEWAGEADCHSPPTLPARRHTRDTDVTKQESIWVIDLHFIIGFFLDETKYTRNK